MGPKSTMIFWVISLLKCCLTWLELKCTVKWIWSCNCIINRASDQTGGSMSLLPGFALPRASGMWNQWNMGIPPLLRLHARHPERGHPRFQPNQAQFSLLLASVLRLICCEFRVVVQTVLHGRASSVLQVKSWYSPPPPRHVIVIIDSSRKYADYIIAMASSNKAFVPI